MTIFFKKFPSPQNSAPIQRVGVLRGDEERAKKSTYLFLSLDGRNDPPGSTTSADNVLVGDREKVPLFDGELRIKRSDALHLGDHLGENGQGKKGPECQLSRPRPCVVAAPKIFFPVRPRPPSLTTKDKRHSLRRIVQPVQKKEKGSQ